MSHRSGEVDRRFRSLLILGAAISLAGLIGHFSAFAEWLALAIYVLGGPGLTLMHCRREHALVAVAPSS